MSEPFVGEIRMFAGNFAPRGWAFCDGQLLAVNQNDALFSLFGTIYGGDGRTTFGLPDLRGRIPLHAGNGPGLTDRKLGSKGGEETETLTLSQVASHNHTLPVASDQESADTEQAVGNVLAGNGMQVYGTTHSLSLRSTALTNTGGSGSHTNLMPFLCVYFIVALFGVYPSRT